MKFGLKDETINRINSVFENYREIDKVIIYGSRVSGTFRNGSDIDLTILGNNITSHTLLKVDTELDDLLTPYMFDLSIFSHIDNNDLIKHINQFGVVFYKKVNLA